MMIANRDRFDASTTFHPGDDATYLLGGEAKTSEIVAVTEHGLNVRPPRGSTRHGSDPLFILWAFVL